MNGNERADFAHVFFIKCQMLAQKKGAEYSVDSDVNGNFKRVATETGQTVEQVWNTFFQKHLDSVRNYIKDPILYGSTATEPIEERLKDAVNYLMILASMIEEKRQPTAASTMRKKSIYGGGDGEE